MLYDIEKVLLDMEKDNNISMLEIEKLEKEIKIIEKTFKIISICMKKGEKSSKLKEIAVFLGVIN